MGVDSAMVRHGADADAKSLLTGNSIYEKPGAELKDLAPNPCSEKLESGRKESEEEPKPAPEGEGEGEPAPTEHARTMAAGTVCSGIAYGLCRLALTASSAEDAVDLAHSLVTSSTAFYGLGSMETHPLHTRALPPRLASGRGPVVTMFSASLGYFIADLLKVSVDVLIRGKYPHLWEGRLAHHTVQIFANSPGIFCRGKPRDFSLAWRSVLCMAYTAEVSNIFLRVSNILRHRPLPGPAGARLQKAANWALVATFFGSRIVNFLRAIFMFIKARSVLPPQLFKMGATVQFLGYTLSTLWFRKIVLIALKK